MAEKPKTTRTVVVKTPTSEGEANLSTSHEASSAVPEMSSSSSSELPPEDNPEAGASPPEVEVRSPGKGFEITVSNRGCGDQRFEATVVWRGDGCCDDPCAEEPEPTTPSECEEPREPTGAPKADERPCEPATPEPKEDSRCPEPETPIEKPAEPTRCIRLCLGLSSELPSIQQLVFIVEAVAKINAQLFARDAGKTMPCCVRCAGLELDEGALLRDARCLLETRSASSASIVAYSMGRELAAGVSCRVVLINGERLAYQREDGSVLDPVSAFGAQSSTHTQTSQEQDDGGHECCCEQRSELPEPG
ncbi:hypothetical protein PPSIR1_21219 [Plesiocystis pacifica SIR-1]|uniref:Uncharacterized protein n=1 Tax=Plesiocystis pacifica SIR-1 TaxID=391625 RepID=A6G3I3_9BACT|nr:hypothetical protein [Plesiocystis pacifica]EDM79590.1 hypothetical protein PPSIR1_21219 [Plesiocystis pacifica SIR-1]